MARIVFAGTPIFAATVLGGLIEGRDTGIVAVYTQPDRPAGRGLKLAETPVKMLARTAGLPVRDPQSLKTRSEQEALAQLDPDLIVTQAVCDVCAVSYDDVVAVAATLPRKPRVVSLDPGTLEEIAQSV